MPILFHQNFGVFSAGVTAWQETGLWSVSASPTSLTVLDNIGPYSGSAVELLNQRTATHGINSVSQTNDLGCAFWFGTSSNNSNLGNLLPCISIGDTTSKFITFGTVDGVSNMGVMMGRVAISLTATSCFTATGVDFADMSWRHIEFYMTLSSGNDGTCKLWVDGVLQRDFAGRTLATSAFAQFSTVILSDPAASTTWKSRFADIVMWSGSDELVSPIGPHRLAAIFPNSAGANTGFSVSSGPNFAAVNDPRGINKDARYIEATASGTTDTYNFGEVQSVAAPNTILGLFQTTYARNTDVGSKHFRHVQVSSGTTFVDSQDYSLTAGYKPFQSFSKFDPATNTFWQRAAVDSAEFGLRAI